MVRSQQSTKFRVVTISPSGNRGQPDYVMHYLSAVSRAGKSLGLNIELLTGKDLEERFRTTDYLIHDILPEDPDYCNQRILPRAVTWYGLEIFRDNFCLSWLDRTQVLTRYIFKNLTTWQQTSNFGGSKSASKKCSWLSTTYFLTNIRLWSRIHWSELIQKYHIDNLTRFLYIPKNSNMNW